MGRFWKRDSELAELERKLRGRRHAAPSGFVRALARRTGGETHWLRPSVRLGLAGGLATVALVAVASAGGFSATRSGADRLVGVVSDLTKSSSTQESATLSPAADQYPKPGKGCGDDNHPHERKYQCKVSISNVSQKEGNSGTTTFSFTISLSDTPLDTITAAWSTANGSAVAPGDYLPAAGTATFAPGVQSQTASVSVVGDTVKEKSETFFVNITSVTGNAFIGSGTGQGTIQNDD